ncbi:hypothetical protein L6452_13577 [Arctium lappa]|uniref:Uncharacterized protein n=1 Tax=Arctium lappa TaxID=4217 RepID=A0ACB9CIJ2_ARCLA|nr:hypothetical protein L6452_13577 [Arctium lappa]
MAEDLALLLKQFLFHTNQLPYLPSLKALDCKMNIAASFDVLYKHLKKMMLGYENVQVKAKEEKLTPQIYKGAPVPAPAMASSSINTNLQHGMSVNASAIPTYSGLCYPFELGEVLQKGGSILSDTYRPLRILDMESVPIPLFPADVIELANLRYLAIQARDGSPQSSISNLVNLQMLIISSRKNVVVPKTIWNMVNLRHLCIKSGENVMEEPCFVQETEKDGSPSGLVSLQTLSQVSPQSCHNIFSRTPNLRKLGPLMSSQGDMEFPNISSLKHLEKLKLLNTVPYPKPTRLLNTMMFPEKLKKLTLSNTGMDWEEMWTLSLLPNLEVLKLKFHACIGERWETSDAVFQQLKILKLHSLELRQWVCMKDNFPALQRLVVHHCLNLESIPSDVGKILTLDVIEFDVPRKTYNLLELYRLIMLRRCLERRTRCVEVYKETNPLVKAWRKLERYLEPEYALIGWRNLERILEDVAEDFLMDLIKKSLLMTTKMRADGQVKACRIHDLLRDLFMLEKSKGRDLFSTNSPGCSCSGSCYGIFTLCSSFGERDRTVAFGSVALVEVNGCRFFPPPPSSSSSSSAEICNMAEALSLLLKQLLIHINQLRYIQPSVEAQDHRTDVDTSLAVLMNHLRMMMLGKLGFCGPLISSEGDLEFPNIRSLEHLRKLKLLNTIPFPEATRSCNPLMFPEKLRKLTLSNTGMDWEEMWIFAWLPNLEVLKLKFHACIGEKWDMSDAKFQRLKILKLQGLDLRQWVCWRDNFPGLQRLVVRHCLKLESIPSDIGKILTLDVIEVRGCSRSARVSAQKIQKEQESEGNCFLKVHTDQQQ